MTNSDNEMPLAPRCESTPNRRERADSVGSCCVSGIELVKEVHDASQALHEDILREEEEEELLESTLEGENEGAVSPGGEAGPSTQAG